MPPTSTAPSPRLFLFAPGAGAPSSSAWMQAWRDRLGALGQVVVFDYSYMRAGRKTPDRLPALIAAHAAALATARSSHAGPVHLIGKSMGSRVGCHLSLEEPVTSLICLGYPLVAASNGAVRDEILVALRTPILFVQGTRDPLCPLDRLEGVRARMTAPHQLLVVNGGNHSLEVPGGKSARAAQEASDAGVLDTIRAFVEASERPAADG
jgi:predicted alpha/beta-hydrolase family hydrolase